MSNSITRTREHSCTRVTVTLPIQTEEFVQTLYDNLPDTMLLVKVFTTADGDPVSGTFYLLENVTEFELGLEVGVLSSIYTETLKEKAEISEALGLDDDELKDCVNSLKEISDSLNNTFSDDRMNIIGQNGNDGEHYSGTSRIEDYRDVVRNEVGDGVNIDIAIDSNGHNIAIDSNGQYYIKDARETSTGYYKDENVEFSYCGRDEDEEDQNEEYFCNRMGKYFDSQEDCDEECQDEDDCDERATERYSSDLTGGVEFTLPPQEYVYDEEESINVIHSMIMKDPEMNKKEDDDSPIGRLFRSFNDFYKKDNDNN